MKLLVHGHSVGARQERLRQAAAGLALRGHEVLWRGGDPPFDAAAAERAAAPPTTFRGIERSGGHRADLVLGSEPIATAHAGWRVGVDGMVLALERQRVRRWNPIHRWCWESLHSYGLLEAGELTDAEPVALPLEPERLCAWSAEPAPASPDSTHADTEILERTCERMLSRRAGMLARPAVFLDRDGTLVIEKGYLAEPAGLELLPGVARALRLLRAAGFALVLVSNQAGVGRGRFSLADVHAVMAELRRQLRGQGVELDAVHFCPHHPDAGCACRKPGTALLEQAAGNLRLDLRRSYMIGDKLLDVATGQAVGAEGVLVRSGYGREEELRLAEGHELRRPARVFEDLGRASEWIVERRTSQPPD